jgi:hypothetical protein
MPSSGLSKSPILLKGALVSFSGQLVSATPTIIAFQYNPESLTRSLEVWGPDAGVSSVDSQQPQSSAAVSQSRAQPKDPAETINLTLEFDAADFLENPDSFPVESVSGIADRIAAIEMLLYPQPDSLIGGLLGSIGGALGGDVGDALSNAANALNTSIVPRGTVPIVLFVWGANRIVPVRLTTFSVEEQAFSPLLFPIRAKVTVGMKVLTPNDLSRTPDVEEELAIAAYNYSILQKRTLAAANVAGNQNAILSLLSF